SRTVRLLRLRSRTYKGNMPRLGRDHLLTLTLASLACFARVPPYLGTLLGEERPPPETSSGKRAPAVFADSRPRTPLKFAPVRSALVKFARARSASINVASRKSAPLKSAPTSWAPLKSAR